MLQPSFFDTEERLKKIDQHGDPLKAINKVVDWHVVQPILTKGLKKPARQKPVAPPMMPL